MRNIGLSIEGASLNRIKVSLDATVRLGPVSFSLLGFSFTVDVGVIKHPDDFAKLIPVASGRGMAAAFDKPPTRIAGSLVSFDDDDDSDESKPRRFTGAAEINSLTDGFGYNSHLALPDVAQVPEFPFIAMNKSGASPLPEARSLNFLG